jgi:hypothetical protein
MALVLLKQFVRGEMMEEEKMCWFGCVKGDKGLDLDEKYCFDF